MEWPTPRDYEVLALDAGISMTEACKRAGVNPAVFHRWKAGNSSPTIRNLIAIKQALETAIAQKAA